MFDVIIAGGTVYDGTGKMPYCADIAVKQEKIADIGNLSEAGAEFHIDASGRYVCPGFIDAHSHSDTYLLIDPSATSKIFQGITTEVVGNCGSSAAPLHPPHRLPSDWETQDYPARWESLSDYRNILENTHPAVNVLPLVGHRNIRVATIGYEHRPVKPDELNRMVRLLETAMDDGGRGLSSGLLYAPASSADIDELSTLARVAARYDGVYTTHMRNEGNSLLKSIEETLTVSRKSGARTQVSHLKAAGRKNWQLMEKAVTMLEDAGKEGLDVAADRYPYTTGYTDLDVVLPNWAQEGGREATLKRLLTPATASTIRRQLMNSRDESDWQQVIIGSTSDPRNRRFRGRSLTEAAADLGINPADAILHFAITDRLCTTAFFGGMSEDNMRKVLSHPMVMIGTDASLRTPGGVLGEDFPHPRAYGSFPRYFRICKKTSRITLEEAVRKVTSLPATQFRLKKRGELKPGNYADLLVFDPAAFTDHSDYSNPHQLSTGITDMLVNGKATIRNSSLTGARSGRPL
jgi:N-acyl-D-amino-acid deacylase